MKRLSGKKTHPVSVFILVSSDFGCVTSLWTTASQNSALPSQLVLFKYKKRRVGEDTAREKLRDSEKWLLRKPLYTLLISTLLPQIPERISLSFPNPLNATAR